MHKTPGYAFFILHIQRVLTFLTRGSCCVIRPMFCPFLPMMKRCSQAGAVTSTTITLLACKEEPKIYLHNKSMNRLKLSWLSFTLQPETKISYT